ncbi:hypothetical protein F5888DRAFT_1637347 [Russula emetica]|nr:hypothetical protein F5888DRAFT_1637347 [Russula emetica]
MLGRFFLMWAVSVEARSRSDNTAEAGDRKEHLHVPIVAMPIQVVVLHLANGSTGLSIRIWEERQLLDEAGLERDLEKLEWLFGGRGERERVERELWPERVGRIGM